MYRTGSPGLSAIILESEFQIIQQAFIVIQRPEIVLAGLQTVEHDIADGGSGREFEVDIIEREFGGEGTVL